MGKNIKAEMPTHIIAVIDKSGSMGSRTNDVIGGFNNFLKDQKKIKDGSYLSLYLFDDTIKRIHHNKDLQEIQPLNDSTYKAGGGTALLDAVGTAISDAGDYKKVILVVITDGEENTSKSFRRDQIKNMITSKEESGWQITYLGAGVDAFGDAASTGFAHTNTARFSADAAGFSKANAYAGIAATSYRGSGMAKTFSSVTVAELANVAANYGSDTDLLETAVDKK